MQAKTKRSLWGRRECEKAENKAREAGRLQKGLERRRKEAEPSRRLANSRPSAPRVDGWKCDSSELMNDVRFRSEEPVLSITLDKVDSNFRRRWADLDVAHASVCVCARAGVSLQEKMCKCAE